LLVSVLCLDSSPSDLSSTLQLVPLLPLSWIYILARSILDALYIYALAGAYREGDLSLIYPIARSAPVFVLLWSTLIWHQPLPPTGVVGIVIVAFGAYVLQLRGLSARNLAAPILAALHNRSIRMAWITALLVAANSLIDDRAVELLDPLVYLYVFVGVSSLLYIPYLLRCGWQSIRTEWQGHWKHILPAAVLGASGYLLALIAYRIEHVGYVTAMRQASIIFGVVFWHGPAAWAVRTRASDWFVGHVCGHGFDLSARM